MSVRVDMSSTDLDRQIALLKFYPELVEKHFKSELYRAAALTKNEILPTIPVMTSDARNTFKSRVTGKGIDMQAQIGWFGKDSAWYINIVEYGAKPHKIESKEGGFLWFGGRVVKSVNHPGITARKFMANGFERVSPKVSTLMAGASERVVNEMAVK